jgi:hypothetical protein
MRLYNMAYIERGCWRMIHKAFCLKISDLFDVQLEPNWIESVKAIRPNRFMLSSGGWWHDSRIRQLYATIVDNDTVFKTISSLKFDDYRIIPETNVVDCGGIPASSGVSTRVQFTPWRGKYRIVTMQRGWMNAAHFAEWGWVDQSPR